MENGIVIVSPHFKRQEFLCHCGECNFEAVDVELLIVLEEIRNEFKRRLFINSGCRCQAWNDHIRGCPNSYHLYGMAADIRVEYTPPRIVQDYIDEKYPEKYGLGFYNDFTHIDMRRKKARWNGETT